MGLRPARLQPTTNMSSSPVYQIPKADLAKLLKEPYKVTLLHCPNNSEQPRVLKEQVPVALAKAFSGYCDANISTAAAGGMGRSVKSSTVCITGGSFLGMKEVVDFWFKFCTNKKHAPTAKSPVFDFWVKVHEAAEILSVDAIQGDAMVEARFMCEKPLTKEDVCAVIEVFPVGHRYNTMVLDNLVAAYFNWDGDFSVDGDVVKDIEKTSAHFFEALNEALNAEASKRVAIEEQAIAEEVEKRRKEEEASAKRVEAEKKAQAEAEAAKKAAEAARGPSFASIAARPPPPINQQRSQRAALAQSTQRSRPCLVNSASVPAVEFEMRSAKSTTSQVPIMPGARTWATVAKGPNTTASS